MNRPGGCAVPPRSPGAFLSEVLNRSVTSPIALQRVTIVTMTGVRMDKWLWAARFFKTRALASKACELGRVSSNDKPAKASREVKVGDLLQITTPGGDFQVEVLALSEIRGPAAVAQTLYSETEESREQRRRAAEERRLMPQFEFTHENKPSKRDSREMDRLRGKS
mgnify:FL=1